MKITVYTISDCQFSKQEKEFLTAHNLPYEEKNLETNKDYLTEMLAVSNNFAGTPVTKIEKDDGQITVLKGYTEAELATALNLAPAPTSTPTPPAPNEAPKAPEPNPPPPPSPTPEPPPTPPTPEPQPVPNETPNAPSGVGPTPEPPATPTTEEPIPVAPVIPPVPPAANEPTAPAPTEPAPTPQNDAMSSILNDLKTKSEPAVPTAAPPSMPNIPDFAATT